MRFFGVALSLLISSNWVMGSMDSDSAPEEEDSANAEARSGVQHEATVSAILFLRTEKRVDLRRAPLLALPSTAFGSHSEFFYTLTKDTVSLRVSISFTSRPMGLLRAPPAIYHW